MAAANLMVKSISHVHIGFILEQVRKCTLVDVVHNKLLPNDKVTKHKMYCFINHLDKI